MSTATVSKILETALLGHEHGLCVIPAEKTKRPFSEVAEGYGDEPTWKHFQAARPGPERLEQWFGVGRRKAIGIVCGAVSGGLELLEFETAEAFGEFQQLATDSGHGPLLARVTDGYLERSGGGGIHLLIRSDACEGNAKLARKPDRKPLVETRGEGGFVVIAPSSGLHADGARYELLRGSLATIPTVSVEERAALWGLARLLDRSPEREQGQTEDPHPRPPLEFPAPGQTAGGGWEVTPLDDFNQRATWSDVLSGWADMGERQGLRFWRRPGKSEGASATTGHRSRCGKDLLICFSTSTALPSERGLSKVAVFAYLEHNGDFRAAYRALAGLGWGVPKRGETDRPMGSDGASAAGRPPTDPGDPGDHDPEQRPTVTITTEIDVVADRAVDLLAEDPSVYQRGRALVHVVRDARASNRRRHLDTTRPAGTPAIVPMTAANVLDRLCRAARWCKLKAMKDGGFEAVPAVLPENVIKAVLERRHWPEIRPLEGIVEVPTLRPDGTILDRPGWDPATGLLFEPSQAFPAIPDRPTREQAKAAAELLLDLVSDFPFKTGHRAAWLAAYLTALARYAIDGPTPLFLIDANTPGAGKSMLADLIALLVAGRLMARSAYPEDDDEVRKLILSVALAGDQMLLFDNVGTGFSVGGAALDGALTATSVKGRILGQSAMTGDVPWNCVLFCTGNNIGLKGDALRRVVPCRLESEEVAPEERTEFKHPDLLGYVRANRGDLVAAGLTILRAFVVAGRPAPKDKLANMDFRAWASLIRHAVHWATEEDPCAGRKELKQNDAETAALNGLVEGWAGLCASAGKDNKPGKVTAAQAVALLSSSPTGHEGLRSILSEWSNDGKLPSTRVIGNRLNRARGRVTDFGRLDFDVLHGNRLWFVKNGPPGDSGDSGDSPTTPRGRDFSDPGSKSGGPAGERKSPEPPEPPHATAPYEEGEL